MDKGYYRMAAIMKEVLRRIEAIETKLDSLQEDVKTVNASVTINFNEVEESEEESSDESDDSSESSDSAATWP